MAISLDELFSDKAHTAIVAAAVAAVAAAAAEEPPEALPPAEDQKEVAKDEVKEESEEEAKEGAKEEPKEEVVELRVPICCEGCVEKIERKLILLDGYELAVGDQESVKGPLINGVVAVECDVEMQKVTVRGTANPGAVLKKARRIQKRSEIW